MHCLITNKIVNIKFLSGLSIVGEIGNICTVLHRCALVLIPLLLRLWTKFCSHIQKEENFKGIVDDANINK